MLEGLKSKLAAVGKTSFAAWLIGLAGMVLLAGCLGRPGLPDGEATSSAASRATKTHLFSQVEHTQVPETVPSDTPLPANTPTWTASPTASPTTRPTETPVPIPSPTPDPLRPYTIESLVGRRYGGGNLQVEDVLAVNSYFTRTLFSYPSDGLTIYGFIDIPQGEGPFPVIVALHGYIDPAIYNTIDYTTRYADALARSDYLVLHPNLRSYPPSDQGDNLYRVGMAVDVMNLLAIVQAGAGAPGPLQDADPTRMGLWGHSMGGGVSTRVITVNPTLADLGGDSQEPAVKAAVLYGAMSGDEKQNFEAIMEWSDGERGEKELAASEEDLERISPAAHFERITAAISIHHGRQDALVPLAWSRQTCEQLVALEKDVTCTYYDGMPHTFYGDGDQTFIQNTTLFFDRVLKSGKSNP